MQSRLPEAEHSPVDTMKRYYSRRRRRRFNGHNPERNHVKPRSQFMHVGGHNSTLYRVQRICSEQWPRQCISYPLYRGISFEWQVVEAQTLAA